MKQKNKTSLESNQEARENLFKWWNALDNNRGDRASLRRSHDTMEVVFNPAYHHLWRDMNKLGFRNKDSLAVVAGVLVHVRNHDGSKSFATQMATPKAEGSNARVSGLRFRRLLKIDNRDYDKLLTSMVRVVKHLDGNVNIYSLANSIYWWNEYTRKQWAYDYYEKAPANEK